MTVRTFTHGDRPTAADMNEIKAQLDKARPLLEAGNIQLPAERIEVGGSASFLRSYRYLHFWSNGLLVDPAGVAKDVSLSEGENGRGVVDLDSLDWIPIGKYYRVEGVNFAQEDWEP